MRLAADLNGLNFGELTVISRSGSNARGDALWACSCSCGTNAVVRSNNLKIGKTRSCGCIRTGSKVSDIAGQKFGRLTALSERGRDEHRGTFWLCRCECGECSVVRVAALRSGSVQSCGCAHLDAVAQYVGSANPNFNPGLTDAERIAGRNFEEYRGWAKAVKERDKYKCVICDESPSGMLVSHHLDSYQNHPELRVSVDNGVCMCIEHHLEFHKKFGFKGTTRVQFENFRRSKYEQL